MELPNPFYLLKNKLSTKNIILFGLMIALFFANNTYGQQLDDANLLGKVNHQKNTIGFIENKGQLFDDKGNAANNVLYYLSTPTLNIFVTTKGLTYVLKERLKEPKDTSFASKINIDFCKAMITKYQVVETVLANSTAFSYYTESSKIKQIHHFSKIQIKNIYPGIDWLLSVSDSAFKYSFIVAPGANPDLIEMEYKGVEGVFKSNNNLHIKTKLGDLLEQNLVAFQNGNSIKTNYKINEKKVSFNVSEYNKNSYLIIDPTLYWSTFVGGNNSDFYSCIDIDNNDNIVVAGFSNSLTFPTVNAGGYLAFSSGSSLDVVISKFNSTLGMVWSTYYGATSNGLSNCEDIATGVKLDNVGNIYVTGYTNSARFPVKRYGTAYYDSILNSGNDSLSYDGFLLKFNSTGGRLWATFIGGSTSDKFHDIACDKLGNVFLVGTTFSSNFPTKNLTGSYFSSVLNGSSSAFITKFSNIGLLNWSTYFGSNNYTEGKSISLDNSSNIFVAGNSSSSSQFPLVNSGNYYQPNISGGTDVFLAKFNVGSSLLWSTFYGGTSNELAVSTAVDNSGNITMVGTTNSSNFPTFAPSGKYLQAQLNNGINGLHQDAFIVHFSTNAVRLWSTYLGGSLDESFDLAFSWMNVNSNDVLKYDKCNGMYLSLSTQSSDIPLKNIGCNSYFDSNLTFLSDAYIAKFNKKNQLVWGSYFGGRFTEQAMSLAITKNSDIIGGFATYSSVGLYLKQPNSSAYFNNQFLGSIEAALVKFKQPDFKLAVNYSKCSGGCTGSALGIINTSCSLSSFSYLWSTGATSSIVNNLCTGNYWLKVVDTFYGCKSDSINFNLNSGFQFTPQYSQNSCAFNCNALASVNIPGGISGVTYSWHLNDTVINNLSSIVHVCPGADTLYINIPGCGSDTAYFNITTPAVVTSFQNGILNPDLYACPYVCNGEVDLVISGGQQNPYCTWSNGVKGTSIKGLCPGQTVTALITDSLCFSTSETITIPNHLTPSVSCGVKNYCSNGVLFASFYPSSANNVYHYQWSSGDTTYITKKLPPGTYSCIITSLCDTFNIQGTILSINTTPLIVKIDTPLYLSPCDTGCNGIVTATIIGGLPMYYYTWSTGIVDSSINTYIMGDKVCANTWVKVTVVDGCGQIAKDSVKIPTHPKNRLQLYTYQLNYGCVGDSNISVSVNASGQHDPMTYLWSTGQTLSTVSGLHVDSTYWVIGIDDCGYRDTTSVKIYRASKLNLTLGWSKSCKDICNGTAYTNIYGGVSPFSYVWSNGATTTLIDSLCHDTTYTCIVTDVCGTKDTNKVKIGLALPLSGTITTTASLCNPNCNATATLHYSGGISTNYFFYWSNNTFSQTASNLCTDSFYHCILSTTGCGIDTFYVHIPSYPKMVTSCTFIKRACDSICNGSALINVTLGIPPYTVLWSSGETTAIANQLCVGQNYCVVTDSCGKTDTAFITIPAYPNPIASTAYNHSSCATICNGSATASSFGGISPYTYLWSTGTTSATANNLCLGTNSCIVTDACISRDTVTVNILQYPPPVISITSNNASCNNICNGSATASGIGGLAPYTYVWSTGTTSATATNLCVGVNTCIITDVCGKSDTASLTIPVYPLPIASISYGNASCTTVCNGVATASGSNSRGPYTYLWSTGSTTATATNLCIGISTCIVTDVCTKKDTSSITILAYPAFNGSVTIQSVSCINQCTGKATASGTGGKLPYTYLWSNGATTAVNTTLCKGSNWCIVSDNCNLHDTLNFTIGIYPTLTATLDSSTNSCINTCNGFGGVSVVGGNPPYSYLWTNGATTATTKSLCIGNNKCIITDACSVKDTVLVYTDTVPLMKYISDGFVNSPTCLPCKGVLSVTIKDGWNPITYLWNTGATTPQISNLCPGFYSVVITNTFCSSDTFRFSHSIISNLKLFTTGVKDATCYDTCNGKGTVVALGGITPYNYLWSNGFTSASSSRFCDGTFTVKITDSTQGYCIDTITINQPAQFNLDTFLYQPHCFNLDGAIKATIIGGTAPYQFLWSTGSTADSIYNLPNGNYWVTVVDSHQCKITQPIYMVGLYPTVQVSPRDTLAGLGQSVTLTATGAVSYHWLNSSNISCDTCRSTVWNSIYNGDTYCVEGIDIYGCSDTACLNIRVYDDCGFIGLPKAFTPNGDGINDIYIPLGPCVEKINFFIFDRWGNLVFESHDKTFGWDGKYKGDDMPMEVYVWRLKAFTSTGRSFDLKGNVTLIR